MESFHKWDTVLQIDPKMNSWATVNGTQYEEKKISDVLALF